MVTKNLQSLVLRNAFNLNVRATGTDGKGFGLGQERHSAKALSLPWYPKLERRDMRSTASAVTRTGRSAGFGNIVVV